MAIIPDYDSQAGLLPAQPGLAEISPNRFGKTGEAIANVGQQIVGIGAQVMEARKRAEETDAIYNKNQDDITWTAKTNDELRQEFTIMNQDGSISFNEQGFSKRFKELADERLQAGIESMPTGDAQRVYRQKSGNLFTQTYLDNLTWENKTRANVYAINFDQKLNAQVVQLGITPDLFNLSKSIEAAGDWINASPASPFSGAEKAELFRLKGKQAIYSYFDGLSRSEGGTETGLQMLASLAAMGGPARTAWSKDGKIQTHDFGISGDNTYMLNFLDGKDFESLKDKLEAKKVVRDRATVVGLKRSLDDSVAAMADGVLDPQISQNADNYLTAMRGKIPDQDWARLHLEANVAKVSGQFVSVAASLPPGDKRLADIKIDAFIQNAMELSNVPANERTQFGYQLRQSFEKHRDNLFAKLVKERNADPVGYLRKHNIPGAAISMQGVANGKAPDPSQVASLLQSQAAIGVEPQNRRLLSKAEAKAIASSMTNDPAPDKAASQILSINAQMGKYSKQYLNELVGGGLNKKYLSVAYVENQQFAREAVDMIKNPDTANALKSIGQKNTEDSLQAEVNSQYRNYFLAISGSGNSWRNAEIAEGIKNTVASRARRDILNGEKVNKAVTNAMDQMIKSSFDYRQGTLIPRVVGGLEIDPRRVEGEMIVRKDWKFLSDKIRPVSGYNAEDKLKKAIGNGRWNLQADNSSSRLEIKNLRGEWIPVLYKDGTPVTVDFVDASQNTSNAGLQAAPGE